MPDHCESHRPLGLGYIQWVAEVERRAKRGMKQRRCPMCLRWMFRDEYGPGWERAERAEAVACQSS